MQNEIKTQIEKTQENLDLITTIMIKLDNKNKLLSEEIRIKRMSVLYLSAISELARYENYIQNNLPIPSELIELIEISIYENNKNLNGLLN